MTDLRCTACIKHDRHPFDCQQAVDIMDAQAVAIQQEYADSTPTYIDWCDHCKQTTIHDSQWKCTSCEQ